MGVGCVKQVGFKPGVKERWTYGWAEWWNRRGRSDGWRNRWVGNGGTGNCLSFSSLLAFFSSTGAEWEVSKSGVFWKLFFEFDEQEFLLRGVRRLAVVSLLLHAFFFLSYFTVFPVPVPLVFFSSHFSWFWLAFSSFFVGVLRRFAWIVVLSWALR